MKFLNEMKELIPYEKQQKFFDKFKSKEKLVVNGLIDLCNY